MSTSHKSEIMEQVRKIIPPLSGSMHKGQAGRVGIVGGSKDYTGAPYFSSMACMRLGADMSHTICQPDAGAVIKTYSPDLIVHRILDPNKPTKEIETELSSLFDRLHSVVVGPGLGRDDFMQSMGRLSISLARKKGLFIVIDADGLWLLQNEPDAIKGYDRAILTPNVMEFKRLCNAMKIDTSQPQDVVCKSLAKAFGGPAILEKGQQDRITNGEELLVVDEPGGLKRCGGQGDVLTGCAGTFMAWGKVYEEGVGRPKDNPIPSSRIPLLAAYGAATVTRTCSRNGFARLGRAMLTNDIIDEVGPAYNKHFGQDASSTSVPRS